MSKFNVDIDIDNKDEIEVNKISPKLDLSDDISIEYIDRDTLEKLDNNSNKKYQKAYEELAK